MKKIIFTMLLATTLIYAENTSAIKVGDDSDPELELLMKELHESEKRLEKAKAKTEETTQKLQDAKKLGKALKELEGMLVNGVKK